MINIVLYLLGIDKVNRTLYKNAKHIQEYVTNCTEQRWCSNYYMMTVCLVKWCWKICLASQQK